MKLLGISGSLRKNSFNTRLLEEVRKCLPGEVDYLLYTCGSLPLYNQELDGDVKPPAVLELLELINNADALLIATPEYNYSLSGVLKNALDWASRPAFKSVLKDCPTGIMSASMSNMGGVRAQIHLKQILGGTLTPVFPAPDFLVPLAHEIFAEDGSLGDPALTERLQQYLRNFLIWAKQPGTWAQQP